MSPLLPIRQTYKLPVHCARRFGGVDLSRAGYKFACVQRATLHVPRLATAKRWVTGRRSRSQRTEKKQNPRFEICETHATKPLP